MTDLLDYAIERRKEMQEDLEKLESFIKLGEQLKNERETEGDAPREEPMQLKSVASGSGPMQL